MRAIFLYVLLFASLHSFGQAEAFLHFDLVPGTSAGSNPDNFIVCNGKIFFTATTSAEGTELWISDGTLTGTKLLKDISSGVSSAFDDNAYKPYFVTMNNKVYFNAYTSASGYELWESDGTVAGTKIVQDLMPGSAAGVLNTSKIAYNGKIYLSAFTASGCFPFVCDGTTMTKLCDADPSVKGIPDNYESYAGYSGKVYFSASEALTNPEGNELWVTDGTVSGTKLLKDINTQFAYAGSNPSNFVVANNKLFFEANDGINGYELWVCNGTAAGTIMLKDINAGATDTKPLVLNWYGVYNNKLYFWAYNGALWSSDGTTAGTQKIGPANLVQPFTKLAGLEMPNTFAECNGKLYFQGGDNTSGTVDQELWVTDGTTPGTKIVKDILPGNNGSSPYQLIVNKNLLYFQAMKNPLGDYHLFRSDGTASGTVSIASGNSSVVAPFTQRNVPILFNTKLYYASKWTGNADNELWAMTTFPASINQLSNDIPSFSLYPNPNKGTFILQIDNADFATASLMVYDLVGKLVHQQTIASSTQTIALQQPAGIYIVSVKIDDAVLTNQVVIE
ncbi:hypothetical protein CAP35_13010 [Chitinophagaceae bacterium IBVUCB1]|nr:hypothetical protein CAP35_13010 [Chitinophagaceae bacterium IBVUCB1]